MERTCCPQYTIRLDAIDFKVGKKHRQVVNRLNRFLGEGLKSGDLGEKENKRNEKSNKGKGKAKMGGEWELDNELRKHEVGHGGEGVHRYTVSFPTSSCDVLCCVLSERRNLSLPK